MVLSKIGGCRFGTSIIFSVAKQPYHGLRARKQNSAARIYGAKSSPLEVYTQAVLVPGSSSLWAISA